MEDQRRQEGKTKIIEQAKDILTERMDSDKVIHYLRTKNVISLKDQERFLQITNDRARARQLLSHLIESSRASVNQLRIALVKAGQPDLLKVLREENATQEEHITNSYDGRCFIHWQGDAYLVAKKFKGQLYIHIRNYDQTGPKNNSNKTRCCTQEVKHLGGGVFITISSIYPTVDIRHFWKPKGSDIPVATKRGISLKKYKWERLCVAMQVMRDFAPELEEACICRFSHPNELELLACKECSPFEEE